MRKCFTVFALLALFLVTSLGTSQAQVGQPFGWGTNGSGELGIGLTDNLAHPTPEGIFNLTGVVQLAGGSYWSYPTEYTLALKSDGTVWGAGHNGYGQLGDGGGTNGTGPIRSTPVQVLNLTGVVQLAAGGLHSLAVKSDGTVWAWGSNYVGQLGNGTYTDSSVPVQVFGLTGVVQVAGSQAHSLALKSDGTVWAWGQANQGQLGNGTYTDSAVPVQVSGLTGVVQIAGGLSHSLAVKSDGTVWAWGSNTQAQLGDGTYLARNVPVQVPGLTDMVQVAGGQYHSLAVKSDGTVWAWGRNNQGQLGDGGPAIDRNVAGQVPGLTGVVQVAGGFGHSLARKSDGTVWAWGVNVQGQVGDGTTTQRSTPVQVLGLVGITQIAAGSFHSLAVQADMGTPDTIAPTVSAIQSPSPNVAAWNNSDVTVTLNATDNSGGSGVAVLTYSINGSTTTVNADNVTLPVFTLEGTYTIAYYATDNAGNQSETGTTTVKIDKTAPVTTVSVQGLQVTLTASDPLPVGVTENSGVALTYYQVDGGTPQLYTAPFNLPAAGTHSVQFWSVDLAGNTENANSQVGVGNDTYITVPNVSGMVGQKKTLTARLRRTGSNLALANQTITFKLDGSVIGTDTTNTNGTASIVYALPETIGTFTITAEFAGDSTNDPSTGSGTLTTTFADTVITVPDKTTQAGDTLNLRATLKRVGDGAIAGKTLTFKIDGVVIGTATTNTNGVGIVSYTAPLEVGSKTITVEYAGSAVYGASVGTGTLTLTKAKTILTVTNRSVRVNKATTLTARLRRVSDGAFVSGASVTISLNGTVLGTLTTDSNGYVNLPYIPSVTGIFTIEATFAGDGIHDASTDTGTLTVNP